MNVARILVLFVALAAGGVAAWLALNVMGQQAEPVEIVAEGPSISTVDVLVAGQDIPLGTTLEEAQLEWRAWPAEGAVGSYLTRASRPDAPTELTGQITKSSFFAGEPITEAKLASTESGFLSAILPAGKRAIATSITADTSAGGFILPNDRVDVIMTRRVDANDLQPERFVTETILNNVRFLAIDQAVEDINGEKVVVGQTATLELTPEQAEILTVAQQMGDRLALSLRSLADADVNRDFTNPDAVHLIHGGGADNRSSGVTVVRNGVARQVDIGR
jgi:pilus assembly protein CpaB